MGCLTLPYLKNKKIPGKLIFAVILDSYLLSINLMLDIPGRLQMLTNNSQKCSVLDDQGDLLLHDKYNWKLFEKI